MEEGADVYNSINKPNLGWKGKWLKASKLWNKHDHTRFVVLSWKRTGSDILCELLYHHPAITMHNELFNITDIITYYQGALNVDEEEHRRWTVLARDLDPSKFLDQIWTGRYLDKTKIRANSKAIGFKAFPENWEDSCNEEFFAQSIMADPSVKKVILHREDELAVYVSMIQAALTDTRTRATYPKEFKVHVDAEKFQTFINNYRGTFQSMYKSRAANEDTFILSYEQLTSDETFDITILPLLWQFLGVNVDVQHKRFHEAVKQSGVRENLSEVISNYSHLEFCFRLTDVRLPTRHINQNFSKGHSSKWDSDDMDFLGTWSILLPMCSRKIIKTEQHAVNNADQVTSLNRLSELTPRSEHFVQNYPSEVCWERLERFARAFALTTTEEKRERTEFVVGIDIDDRVFSSNQALNRIRTILPSRVKFVTIKPELYGKVCRIWNLLGMNATNDFILLLGDDIELMDSDWQCKAEKKFAAIAERQRLPYGAACVAMNDITFPGFPTFPILHRWHIKHFGEILPEAFVNQGGDPYLFELYSRWNAVCFLMDARLRNTIGGDSDARYFKHDINWKCQVLPLNLTKLQSHLDGRKPTGICLDVVVPSYRLQNLKLLGNIIELRASIPLNVRFWLVVDDPDPDNLREIQDLARSSNERIQDGNYFASVLSYGENRGAAFARNVGFNASTADWVLFLDDDIIPDEHILDAYAGSIFRYPYAKVMVGYTEMPSPCNLWTEMITASNVIYFFGIAETRVHPPWGVTANIMVRGSRHDHTIQFKTIYPRTGGGEDLDFVFQIKERNKSADCVVAVPGAKAQHPWWREGKFCYRQICGWAWGDSLCLTEWPEKSFLVLPNWIEFICLLIIVAVGKIYYRRKLFVTAILITITDLLVKTSQFYKTKKGSIPRSVLIAIGASSVISAQECSRMLAIILRKSMFSFSRRMDWFDGEAQMQVTECKVRSAALFIVYCVLTWVSVVAL